MKRAIFLLAGGLLLTGCADSVSGGFKAVGHGLSNIGNKAANTVIPGHKAAAQYGKKVYFVVEADGERRSKGFRIRSKSTYNSEACLVTETEQTTEILRENTKFVQTVQRKTITTPEGLALYANEVTLSGTERRSETVTIKNGQAEFETVNAGGADRQTVAVPKGVMFGLEPGWLIAQGLQEGKNFEGQVLNRSDRKVVTERAVVKGKATEDFLGTQTPVWLVDSSQEGRTPVRMVFTEDGELVRLESAELLVRTVTQAEAEREAPLARVNSTVPLDFELPAWDNFSSLVYQLEPAADWRKHLTPCEYYTLNDDGGTLEVTLNRVAPRLRKDSLPMQVPPEIQPYLEKAENIWPHKREIQNLARDIIRGEKDALRAVALLAGWVNQKVQFQQRDALNNGPLRTIESRRGDCSEHADLFASLARSLGLPTRHCKGLIIQRERAVYHTWCEVWIAGNWVPVDTTVNRVGLPAGYMLTARGTGDGQPRDEFAWTLRQSNLLMKLVSATKVNERTEGAGKQVSRHTLIPGEKRTYVAVDDRWLANLYWGFSLIRPDEWTGKVTLNSVELKSDDGQASVKCESLPTEFRANDASLDRVVASLEKSLESFRNRDSRIVTFGRPYAVSTLFIDFTCTQGGTVLRCQQYVIPKRGRSYRLSFWAPADRYANYQAVFQVITESLRF